MIFDLSSVRWPGLPGNPGLVDTKPQDHRGHVCVYELVTTCCVPLFVRCVVADELRSLRVRYPRCPYSSAEAVADELRSLNVRFLHCPYSSAEAVADKLRYLNVRILRCLYSSAEAVADTCPYKLFYLDASVFSYCII